MNDDELRKMFDRVVGPNIKLMFGDIDLVEKICGDDKFSRFAFITRFGWFLSEIQQQVNQQKAETAIMGTPGFFDLPKEEQDELLKPIYDNWQHDLFTPESFERYYKQQTSKSKNNMVP